MARETATLEGTINPNGEETTYRFEYGITPDYELVAPVPDGTIAAATTGQDVTEQYTDLEAQLRNAKAQEEVYLEILKQAKTVEDILLVQDRLGNIRAVIEGLEGRIKYLENATSYSTITVSLQEEPVVRAPTKEFRLGASVRRRPTPHQADGRAGARARRSACGRRRRSAGR